MFRAYILILGIAISQVAMAQDSLDLEVLDKPTKNFTSSQFKPSVGFGLGTMSFYGDVGNGYKAVNPFTANAAFSFHAKLPLSTNLDLTFRGMKTKLTVNEPGMSVLNNFQSEVTGGSAIITYNFNRFLNKSTFWRPFVGTGISSFEFLSKTDLYDSNGMRYHLWSNGALMSKPEDAIDSHDAIPLSRDFIYETDLRGLNEDEEPYSDYSVALPLTAGIDFKFSKHFKATLQSTVFLSLNDNVDNVSTGDQSDAYKDKFVHTSLGFSYDLSFGSKYKKSYDEIEFEDEEEALLADYFDTDLDGVNDLDDDDLGHPEGVPVDSRGVPLDEDGDGVPDFRDDEPMTPDSLLVDEFGVAIDDQDLLDKYMVWIDSLGSQTLYSKVFGEKPKDNFAVLVIPDKDGFNQEQINKILSQENVRQKGIDSSDGYLVGDYENFKQAIDKKHDLENDGLNSSIAVTGDEGDFISMTNEEEQKLENFVRDNPANYSDYEDDSKDKVVFRVQVGAFKYDLSKNIFKNINDLIVLPGDDGLTRYMSSSYETSAEAAKRRVDLLTEGFEGSFITAYRNGKRITLAEAGLKVTPNAKDLIVDTENNSITKEDISFKVCLGEYAGDVPTEDLDALLAMDNVKPLEKDGVTRFMTSEFKTVEEAEAFLATLKNSGLSNPSIVGSFNGEEISLEEAFKILGK